MAKGRDEEYLSRRGEFIASNPAEAQRLGVRRYYGEAACCYGHFPAIRILANGTCQDCHTATERPTALGYIESRKELIASNKKEALSLGVRRYYGAKSCSRGHNPTVRWVANGNCQDCNQWHGQQRVEKMMIEGTWAAELSRIREERYSTPEKTDKTNQLAKDWYRRFPEKALANSRDRKIRKRRRTTPWADKKQITVIYKTCRELTRSSGKAYQVDHIVPLNGKQISGLHVQGNLQVIPKEENMEKFNHFDLDNLLDAIDWTAEYHTKGWIPVSA